MANPIKIPAHVSEILPRGPGVYVVSFACERAVPRFRAGQFLHLSVDDFDPTTGFWPESRVFSIASRSGSDGVCIVYSVKGAYTKKMEQYLAPGKRVWLKLPYGSFVIDAAIGSGEDAVLIAGGTGISPFVPFLEERNASGWREDPHVHLAYGVRSPRHIVFPEMLARAQEFGERFSLDLFVEDDDAPMPFACRNPIGRRWERLSGRPEF
jgi:NAD(P)H-flavin reductase